MHIRTAPHHIHCLPTHTNRGACARRCYANALVYAATGSADTVGPVHRLPWCMCGIRVVDDLGDLEDHLCPPRVSLHNVASGAGEAERWTAAFLGARSFLA